MWRHLLARAEAHGARRAAALAARLARAVDVPGVTTEPVEGGVRLHGTGLRRRLLEDSRLRWIGDWLR